MFDNMTPEQRQNLDRYNNDLDYKKQIDAIFSAQRNQPTVTHLMDMSAGDGSQDNWKPRIVRSTPLDNFMDVMIRVALFAIFGGIILFGIITLFVMGS